MEVGAEEWGRQGATLSDKTARSQYGLTQEEIYAAIDAGKLRYRPAAMHGNPWLLQLRREVEDLVRARSGDRYLRERRARTELAQINRELKQLRVQLTALDDTVGQMARAEEIRRFRGHQAGHVPGRRRPAGSGLTPKTH